MKWRWELDEKTIAAILKIADVPRHENGLFADIADDPTIEEARNFLSGIEDLNPVPGPLVDALTAMAEPEFAVTAAVLPAGKETSPGLLKFALSKSDGPCALFTPPSAGSNIWDIAFLPSRDAALVVLEDLMPGEALFSKMESAPPAKLSIAGLLGLFERCENSRAEVARSLEFATEGALSAGLEKSTSETIAAELQASRLAEAGDLRERGQNVVSYLERILRTTLIQIRHRNGEEHHIAWLRSPESLIEVRRTLDTDGSPLFWLREVSVSAAIRSAGVVLKVGMRTDDSIRNPPPVPKKAPPAFPTKQEPPPVVPVDISPPPAPAAAPPVKENRLWSWPEIIAAASGLCIAFLCLLVGLAANSMTPGSGSLDAGEQKEVVVKHEQASSPPAPVTSRVPYWRDLAESHIKAGNREEADKTLDLALAEFPQSGPLMVQKALNLVQVGRLRDARFWTEKAKSLGEQLPAELSAVLNQTQGWTIRGNTDDLVEEVKVFNKIGRSCVEAAGRKGMMMLVATNKISTDPQYLIAGNLGFLLNEINVSDERGFAPTTIGRDDEGRWFAVVRKKDDSRPRFCIYGKLSEIQPLVEEQWNRGFRIIEIEGSDEGLLILFEYAPETAVQRFLWAQWSDMDTMIRSHWDDGWRIQTIAYDNTRWITVMVQDTSSMSKQTYVAAPSTADLKAQIAKAWDEGSFVTSVAGHPDLWLLIISSGTAEN